MPRKRKTNENIINKLKELLDNYHEIIELEEKLNEEKFLVTKELQNCLIDIKNNIISKL